MISFREIIKNVLPDPLWLFLQKTKLIYQKFKFRFWKRPYKPGETSKARKRRIREGFFENYCKGKGLDIGFGGDLITDTAYGFDFEHGDALYLKKIKDNTYDFVYSSHTIEHLPDPSEALKNWFRVVKPEGYLIIYLPHRDLYEKKKTLPSRFNPTHLHFFLPDRDEKPDTIGVLPLIERSLTKYELIYIKICNEGNTIKDPLTHSDGEYSIEVVLRKNR